MFSDLGWPWMTEIMESDTKDGGENVVSSLKNPG
jgi:hypothetical protein